MGLAWPFILSKTYLFFSPLPLCSECKEGLEIAEEGRWGFPSVELCTMAGAAAHLRVTQGHPNGHLEGEGLDPARLV